MAVKKGRRTNTRWYALVVGLIALSLVLSFAYINHHSIRSQSETNVTLSHIPEPSTGEVTSRAEPLMFKTFETFFGVTTTLSPTQDTISRIDYEEDLNNFRVAPASQKYYDYVPVQGPPTPILPNLKSSGLKPRAFHKSQAGLGNYAQLHSYNNNVNYNSNTPMNIQDIIRYFSQNDNIRDTIKKTNDLNDDGNTNQLYYSDPFGSFKPSDPGDVNLLAQKKYRFAPTTIYPHNHRPSESPAPINLPNLLFEKKKKLSVMLDIYPMPTSEDTLNDQTTHEGVSTISIGTSTNTMSTPIPIRNWTHLMAYPKYANAGLFPYFNFPTPSYATINGLSKNTQQKFNGLVNQNRQRVTVVPSVSETMNYNIAGYPYPTNTNGFNQLTINTKMDPSRAPRKMIIHLNLHPRKTPARMQDKSSTAKDFVIEDTLAEFLMENNLELLSTDNSQVHCNSSALRAKAMQVDRSTEFFINDKKYNVMYRIPSDLILKSIDGQFAPELIQKLVYNLRRRQQVPMFNGVFKSPTPEPSDTSDLSLIKSNYQYKPKKLSKYLHKYKMVPYIEDEATTQVVVEQTDDGNLGQTFQNMEVPEPIEIDIDGSMKVPDVDVVPINYQTKHNVEVHPSLSFFESHQNDDSLAPVNSNTHNVQVPTTFYQPPNYNPPNYIPSNHQNYDQNPNLQDYQVTGAIVTNCSGQSTINLDFLNYKQLQKLNEFLSNLQDEDESSTMTGQISQTSTSGTMPIHTSPISVETGFTPLNDFRPSTPYYLKRNSDTRTAASHIAEKRAELVQNITVMLNDMNEMNDTKSLERLRTAEEALVFTFNRTNIRRDELTNSSTNSSMWTDDDLKKNPSLINHKPYFE